MMISFMSLVRLDQDNIEIGWITSEISTVNFTVKNVSDGAYV